MRNQVWTGALIFLLLFISSCSRRQAADEAQASNAQQSDQAVEVEASRAEERTIDRSVEIVGALAADERIVVSSEVEGRIAEMTIDLGSFVRQGDVIAKLDSRDFELRLADSQAALQQVRARLGIASEQDRVDPAETATIRQAKASLDDVTLRVNRVRQLRARGVVSQQDLDQAEANFRIAEARYQAAQEEVNNLLAQLDQRRTQLAIARRELEKTVIYSPITGSVVERSLTAGEYVRKNERVATLVKTNPLRLRADVPERYAGQVYAGRQLSFSVDALPGKTFQGKIARLSPAVSTETRSLAIEAEIENRANELRPGYFARAQVVVEPGAKAVVVPAKAVVAYVGVLKVFVVEKDHAVERQVKLGTKLGDLVEITDGVRPGELVITTNLNRMFDGARVRSRA
jgi:RND family efflux transporter MFP subunit